MTGPPKKEIAMILCPFCGSEMPDEARACPSCRSVLVERKEPGKKRELPPALHPMVTFTVILVASAALLAASLIRTSPGPARKPKPGPVAQAPAPEPPAETPIPTEPPRNLTPVAPANANQDPREAYEKFIAYETKVKETLAEVDKLQSEMEDLRRDNTPENRQAMSEKLNAMRTVRQQLRAVEPPVSLRRANTHVSNSVDITMRGYRSFIIYMESGDLSKLDQGRKDLNKAQKYRSQALQEINEQKSRLTPPPPEPTPEPEPAKPPVAPPATPPATPPAVKPGDTRADNPNRMFPPGYQPQPGDQPGDRQPPADNPPEDYPPEGDPGYQPDDQPYPQDGHTYSPDGQPYPQDGDSAPAEYPDDQYPDGQYPEDQPPGDNGGYIQNPY